MDIILRCRVPIHLLLDMSNIPIIEKIYGVDIVVKQ